MTTQFDLPKWYDLHVHLRQGDLLPITIQDHLKAQCAGILAMPNTKPPVAKIFEKEPLPYWSIEQYRQLILDNGGKAFKQIIIPLYLTKDTTKDMIRQGAESGLLKACKYYPPHGTTNSEFGCDFKFFINNGVFEAMEKYGIVLCVHGEQAQLSPEQYFDQRINAEMLFYQENMPTLCKNYPNLKIVCEHITTEVAVEFVKNSSENVKASITPQHLLYTVGHLLQGLKFHLYCLPLLKFENDREALRQAIADENNTQFFAGTDSAPHTVKATDCGCAAGCYTAPIAPQLYAQAFEMAGLDLSKCHNQQKFRNFLCNIGAQFYDLPVSEASFTLIKKPLAIQLTYTESGAITPLPVGMNLDYQQPTTIDWQIQ